MRVECPECRAGLKSPTGFEPGEVIDCPKCETTFTVAEELKEEAPKKSISLDEAESKKRIPNRRRKKTSPWRYVGIGGLVVTMLVLGVMLILKEREEAKANGGPQVVQAANPRLPPPPRKVEGKINLKILPPDPSFRPLKPTILPDDEVEAFLDQLVKQTEMVAVPDHRERKAEMREKYHAWYKSTSTDVFEKTAGAKAPWADKARKAFEFRARELSLSALSGQDPPWSMATAEKLLVEAIAAGCDDPLLVYWRNQLVIWFSKNQPDYQRSIAITKALDASAYPDVRKLHGVHNLVAELTSAPASDPARKELPAWEQRFWELYDAVAASPDPIARQNISVVNLAWTANPAKRGLTNVAAWKTIVERLQKPNASEYDRLMATSYLASRTAFAARGEGVASTVTPEGWRIFGIENKKAKEALEKAWELDPERWEAPTMMLNIGRNLSFERDEIEQWFNRAMKANPDNTRACLDLFDYLLPKWHGSPEECIAFAWQCLKSGNATAHIPLGAVLSILADHPVNGTGDDPRTVEYYSSPYVWFIIRRGLELELADRPDSQFLLSHYARLACVCGHYGVADEQFEKLGELNYWPSVFGDQNTYRIYRERARAQAKAQAK